MFAVIFYYQILYKICKIIDNFLRKSYYWYANLEG